MALRDLVLDRWAELSFKQGLTGDGSARTSFRGSLAPTWVGPDHQRRLAAYKVLAAYLSNVSREFLPSTLPEADRAKRREYGEPDLIVDRVVAGVLGDQVEIVVDRADTDLTDAPTLPDEPQDPGPDASESDRIIFDARQRVWREEVTTAVTQWEADRAEVPRLRDRQDWLRQWADDELLEAKLWEAEHDGAVGLGDAVYVLTLSHNAGRPVLDVYDPGHYFPVLTDTDRGYPRKVHLAWEFDTVDRGETRRWVRRITWELVDLATVVDGVSGAPVRARRYPWQPNSEQASTRTCVMSDATWPLDDLVQHGVDDFDLARATYARNDEDIEVNRLDLHIDFIPVVHVPNTPSTKEHFGRSILARVLQLVDDLQASDTDRQAAAALAAGPVIGLSGAKAAGENTRIAPGKVFNLGEGGRMDVLDLSGSVVALGGLVDDLLDRLSVNVQVSGEVLGRVDAQGDIAGITVALRFGPFEQLIRVLRLVRDSKYSLLLRFVQRLAQAGQYLDPGPTPTARLAFGSFLPSDRSAAVEQVVKLLQAKSISRRTALKMLVDAGIEIGDLSDEQDSIETSDFEGARELADALNAEAPAYEYLGIEQPETPTPAPVPPPAIDLRPPGG